MLPNSRHSAFHTIVWDGFSGSSLSSACWMLFVFREGRRHGRRHDLLVRCGVVATVCFHAAALVMLLGETGFRANFAPPAWSRRRKLTASVSRGTRVRLRGQWSPSCVASPRAARARGDHRVWRVSITVSTTAAANARTVWPDLRRYGWLGRTRSRPVRGRRRTPEADPLGALSASAPPSADGRCDGSYGATTPQLPTPGFRYMIRSTTCLLPSVPCCLIADAGTIGARCRLMHHPRSAATGAAAAATGTEGWQSPSNRSDPNNGHMRELTESRIRTISEAERLRIRHTDCVRSI